MPQLSEAAINLWREKTSRWTDPIPPDHEWIAWAVCTINDTAVLDATLHKLQLKTTEVERLTDELWQVRADLSIAEMERDDLETDLQLAEANRTTCPHCNEELG
jgi:hypothetical protein